MLLCYHAAISVSCSYNVKAIYSEYKLEFDVKDHKINIDDITPNWISQLKDEHAHATLEIKIHGTDTSATNQSMNESEFWSIINLLDWEKGENEEEIMV